MRLTKLQPGFCPICQAPTLFVATSSWLRDGYLCVRCKSVPRFRALIHVLERHFPAWRTLEIYESAPDGSASRKLARECPQYVSSQFTPDASLRPIPNGCRLENLERLSFSNASFDLVVTQDVLEHVLHPEQAFSEISRVLKPGGAHVFTLPWCHWQDTRTRAIEKDGQLTHLLPPKYHANPVDPLAALVVTEWGSDLLDFVLRASGLATIPIRIHDPWRGIEAEFIEVFISRKTASHDPAPPRDPEVTPHPDTERHRLPLT